MPYEEIWSILAVGGGEEVLCKVQHRRRHLLAQRFRCALHNVVTLAPGRQIFAGETGDQEVVVAHLTARLWALSWCLNTQVPPLQGALISGANNGAPPIQDRCISFRAPPKPSGARSR